MKQTKKPICFLLALLSSAVFCTLEMNNAFVNTKAGKLQLFYQIMEEKKKGVQENLPVYG